MGRPIDRNKETWWRRVLLQGPGPGQTIRAYCEQVGVSEQNFYRWRQRLADPTRAERPITARRRRRPELQDAPLFVPVEVAHTPTPNSIELILKNGQVVRVLPGFDAATLAQLVAVLEGPSC